jgi:benzoylformate decarboxylase
MGMLYNAAEGRTPLLVYVGQSAQSGLYLEPTLSSDFATMAAPVAKWATEVRTADEIPQVVARAIKVATTDPCGPVVVAVPMDLMNAECSAAVCRPSVVDSRVTPSAAALDAAAAALAGARRPVIVVGDGVARADAIDDVSDLARLIGAPIYGGFMSETCIDPDDPLNAGRLPSIDSGEAERALIDHDVVVAIGTKVLSNVFTRPGLPLGAHPVVHIGLDAWELAKNQPATVVYGDEAHATRNLIERLRPVMASRAAETAARVEQCREDIARRRARAIEADQRRFDAQPMTVERAMAEIGAVLARDVIVVDESLTGYAALGRYLRLQRQGWYRLRGGGIGAGMPLPIGIQLARPEQRVVAFVGDGSAMYTISAMWTAAHHRLPVVWVVLNNASYRVLKENLRRDGVDAETARQLLGADLVDPRLDFVSLAAGLGVAGSRVDDAASVGPALLAALDRNEPYLLELAIDGELSAP